MIRKGAKDVARKKGKNEEGEIRGKGKEEEGRS